MITATQTKVPAEAFPSITLSLHAQDASYGATQPVPHNPQREGGIGSGGCPAVQQAPQQS